MLTVMAEAYRAGKPMVIFDIESNGMLFDVKTHKYWSPPKVRTLTKMRRDYDTKRWWKRFFA